MSTVLIGLGLAGIVAAIIAGLVRDKKRGASACGGDCAGCGGCSACRERP